MYAYTDWANARLVEAVESLTPEQWTRPIVGSFGSVRATFSHVVLAEWLWLRRWRGESPAHVPEWESSVAVGVLTAQIRSVAEERRLVLDRLTEVELQRVVECRNLAGEKLRLRLIDLLMHVVNHSTFHRGQVVMMLRQLGVVPPSTDLLEFAALSL